MIALHEANENTRWTLVCGPFHLPQILRGMSTRAASV